MLHHVEDLDRVMAKYIIKFAPISRHLMQEKGKSRDKKREEEKLAACENRRKIARLIFRSLGRAPLTEDF